MAEVRLGELAREKAGSARVKAFGARMVEDHSRANTELKAVALPTDPELNAFAERTLGTLRHHLQEIETVARSETFSPQARSGGA